MATLGFVSPHGAPGVAPFAGRCQPRPLRQADRSEGVVKADAGIP